MLVDNQPPPQLTHLSYRIGFHAEHDDGLEAFVPREQRGLKLFLDLHFRKHDTRSVSIK
jgi:hypothetical protein